MCIFRLNQLKPLFEANLTIKEITDKKSLIVEHPNGRTANEIINEKLRESSETKIPSDIQGKFPSYFNFRFSTILCRVILNWADFAVIMKFSTFLMTIILI